MDQNVTEVLIFGSVLGKVYRHVFLQTAFLLKTVQECDFRAVFKLFSVSTVSVAYTLRKINPKVKSNGNMVGSLVKLYTAVAE